MKILILVLVGITCLWFFGKTQPIIVIDHATANNRLVTCSKCRGSGSVEVPAACLKCKGTGKGEWPFKSQSKEKLSGVKPICLGCNGTGKFLRWEKCPQCASAGRITVSESQKIKTTKADLSLWEKILAYCLLKPDPNCKPQRRMDGSYPLIVKYIEITVNPAYNTRVVKWTPARRAGSEWIVETAIEFKDKNGQWTQEDREFIIENREVKSCRMKNAGIY